MKFLKYLIEWFESFYATDRFLQFLLTLLFVVLSVLLVNSMVTPSFNTPLENVVRRSNEQLRENYKQMQLDYNLMDSVLRFVNSRDKIIYRQLFGVEQPSEDAGEDIKGIISRDSLEKMPFEQLAVVLLDKSNELEGNIKSTSSELQGVIKSLNTKTMQSKIRYIPSMQPVNNSDLLANITSTGMKINPFVRTFVFHKGIDYPLAEGTRVFATANGKVKYVSENDGAAGGTITIDHGYNYTTIYKYLSRINIQTGQTVKRGDIIGYSGNSGSSFLPHLHYEVKYKTSNLDPLCFLFGELSHHQLHGLRERSELNIQSFD